MTTANAITVNAAHMEAALQAVSKEETRYYLKGVFLDGRGYIAATNGHIMFAARCADAIKLATDRPAFDTHEHSLPGVIVPSDAIAQAIKAAGRTNAETMLIERDPNGLWWIFYGNGRIAFTPIDGSFPDWQRPVPTPPETLTAAHYQPQYIAALGNMAKALRNGKKDEAQFFTLHQNGENPALVTFPFADVHEPRTDCIAVIMPYRMSAYAGATFTGTFLTPPEAAEAA
jgi:hypothetical protein